MHISHIKLKNIRGFKELDFDLAHGVDEHGQTKYAGWIVFTGSNGAGKSTLLKAIAAGLVKERYALILEPNIDLWIRDGEKEAKTELTFIRGTKDDFFEGNKEYPHSELSNISFFPIMNLSISDSTLDFMKSAVDALDNADNSSLEKLTRNFVSYYAQCLLKPSVIRELWDPAMLSGARHYFPNSSNALVALPESFEQDLKSLAGISQDNLAVELFAVIQSDPNWQAALFRLLSIMTTANGPLSKDARGWFSCAYGPFRRVFGASQEATQLMTGEVVERFATLFQEAASLYEADRWLRDLKYKTLEGNESAKAQLEIVLELLRDEFMPNQITLKDVNSDGLWLEDRNGLRLAWRDMSDGYRAALALLSDILRQLIRKFGVEGLAARNAEGRLYITRSGVVLIDEVDAHLHPEWQREISGWLKRHFPHIQFLVTTHSPLICQAADKIFVLPEPGSDDKPYALSDAQLQEVRASKSDAVLRSPAFGLQNTRSELAVENLAEFTKLRSKQRAGATLTATESSRLVELDSFIHADKEL